MDKDLPLSHTCQREQADCVIATVASVANMTYEAVRECCPRLPGKKGYYPLEVRKLLQDTTNLNWKRPRVIFFRRLLSLCDAQSALILFIRKPGNFIRQRIFRQTQHCIFVCNGLIFDPEFGQPLNSKDYPRMDWIPTMVFRPANNEELIELQKSNFAKFRDDRLWSDILA